MKYCQSTTPSAAQPLEETNAPTLRLFSREEACVYLRCSIRTLHLWLYNGKLPFSKVGKRVWFKKEDLDHFIVHHQNL